MPSEKISVFRFEKGLFIFLVVLVLLNLNRHQWSADIHGSSDDIGYLAYAMSFGLDFDADFSGEADELQFFRAGNGKVPKGFYGPGLMAAPFVALFSTVDRLQNHEVIEDRGKFVNSWTYFGFSFAVHFYFLASVFLFWRSAILLTDKPSLFYTLLFCVGSGVIYYVLSRVRMSHSFEFFGLSLITYATMRYRELGELKWSAAAAAGVSITLMVRFSDLNVIALPVILLLLQDCLSGRDNAPPDIKKHIKAAFIFALLVIFFYLPVAYLNNEIYGVAIPHSQAVYGLAFPHSQAGSDSQEPIGLLPIIIMLLQRLPGLAHIFFGAEFGLLYSSPIMVFGLGLLTYMLLKARRNKGWLAIITLLLAWAYAGFSLAVALIWAEPGMSYGWRYLYPIFPLGFVGYFIWWSDADKQTAIFKNVIHVSCVGLCVFSFLGAVLFTKTESLSYRVQENYFGVNVEAAPNFNANLLKEVFSADAWETAVKDGTFGYVNKMYINRTYLRWKFDQLLHGKEGTVMPPRRQHPPVVGIWILILFGLWGACARICIGLNRR
ncbi:MAG: hypothetical protein A3G18_13480 [Rhodospirillales bacterium RIFCSPLOWO2_12_FULL_58_28]|nr:MAG: hypothetical protein A3H92_13335 [Rhodospirillales bacterium RIFCSPLOWO2_02_FULL_58_16]OHC78584.1 MAG: hypothetical protein A3G18_13480 [Rhodospirillales bacterium RIFCSPLOWO2_12_FULL_58_28]